MPDYQPNISIISRIIPRSDSDNKGKLSKDQKPIWTIGNDGSKDQKSTSHLVPSVVIAVALALPPAGGAGSRRTQVILLL